MKEKILFFMVSFFVFAVSIIPAQAGMYNGSSNVSLHYTLTVIPAIQGENAGIAWQDEGWLKNYWVELNGANHNSSFIGNGNMAFSQGDTQISLSFTDQSIGANVSAGDSERFYVGFGASRSLLMNGEGWLLVTSGAEAEYNFPTMSGGSSGQINLYEPYWNDGVLTSSYSLVEANYNFPHKQGELYAAIYLRDQECATITLNGWVGFDPAFKTSTPVPIPGAIWLFGSGLVGLVSIRRKRN